MTTTTVSKRTSGPMPSPDEVLRALADPERLAIAGMLARRQASVSEISEALAIATARVRRHLGRLTSAGVIRVEADRRSYRLDGETLRLAAQEVGPSKDPGLALGAIDREEESVLRQYFQAGRLREIPAKRSKRLIVLTRIALEFEVGIRYPERDVDTIVHRFHDDHAAIRRYLVEEGLLSREGGVYWRTGGPVDLGE
jgi:hypothetical protein